MRKLNSWYNIIYTDLDNTLIYGFMTDLMDITWRMFKSQKLAEVLMYIQAIFKLYKTNDKLIYQIKQSNLPVVIMTARKPSRATQILVKDLDFEDQGVCVWEMNTRYPEVDKINAILNQVEDHDEIPILFEDNKETMERAVFCGINVMDATTYYEKKVG